MNKEDREALWMIRERNGANEIVRVLDEMKAEDLAAEERQSTPPGRLIETESLRDDLGFLRGE